MSVHHHDPLVLADPTAQEVLLADRVLAAANNKAVRHIACERLHVQPHISTPTADLSNCLHAGGYGSGSEGSQGVPSASGWEAIQTTGVALVWASRSVELVALEHCVWFGSFIFSVLFSCV